MGKYVIYVPNPELAVSEYQVLYQQDERNISLNPHVIQIKAEVVSVFRTYNEAVAYIRNRDN